MPGGCLSGGTDSNQGNEMTEETKAAAEKHITINKVYLKDFSFESPQTPGIFAEGEWKPQTNLNLRSSHADLENNLHEVVLTITVEAKEEEKTLKDEGIQFFKIPMPAAPETES